MFQRKELTFDFSALEPFIDAQTMEIHSTKHHQGYVNKLNAALEDFPEYQSKSIEDLLINISQLPQEIQTAVRNNGGGHHNHTLFFGHLTPNKTQVPESLLDKINQSFGSFEEFKERFALAAGSVFGSGWAFLCLDTNDELVIQTQANQDSPLSDGLKPIMGIDVWEHAYYIDTRNNRAQYLENYWALINWSFINEQFK